MENEKRFAVISEANIIENIIVASEIEFVQMFFENNLIVEENQNTGIAVIGMRYSNSLNRFEQPNLYSSWTFDEDSFLWKPPIPYPDSPLPHFWSEEAASWVLIPDATFED